MPREPELHMTIRASVERTKSDESLRVDYGEIDFVALPRVGERVTIDGVEQGFTKTEPGLVSAVEHLIGTDGSPTITVFVAFE